VPNADANVIHFQCPNCGFELEQTVGLIKAEKRIVCGECHVGINVDIVRLLEATEVLHAAVPLGPNEITIRFFR
jgi:transcription elongation factor Elf1